MFQRPKVGETEEDLLKQEEEFLKQSGKEPTRKRTHEVTPNEPKVPRVAGLIGEIVEKNQTNVKVNVIDNVGLKQKGFPTLFDIDPNIASNKKTKKSLFALHMEKNKSPTMPVKNDNETQKTEIPDNSFESGMECDDTFEFPGNKDKMDEIHNENLEKLSKMTKDQILESQKKLHEMLSPETIAYLKSRAKKKEQVVKKEEPEPEDVEMREEIVEDSDIKEKLSGYVGEKWVNMDFIEKEKLEWVGDIPDSKALEPDKPYSARFDFKGELQPFSTEIDVTKSLHHHGDEPERPGYTIQELYQLSRSTVLQQRILALNTLANIIRKTKLGYYDVCFDGFLLHKLLESDLFLLLRFSIDENALIPSAINCLRRLLYNDTDEYCLDKLLGITEFDVQPLIYDEMETNKDEEKELKDHTIINCDVIKGVLRTDLVVRITYILNNMSCDRETITNAILCFIRISRHSLDSSKQIINKPDLLDFVYSCIKCNNPIYQGVKLFRILIGQSEEFASHIAVRYPMLFLFEFVNMEELPEISKVDFYLLKLECLYLWRNMLKYNLMIDEFQSWTPCFIRLLRFYIEKVDLTGEGDFDFEMFCSMMSILRLCVCKKQQIDPNYISIMYVLVEKWLRQLIRFEKFNYAGLKALGISFEFCIDYFRNFEIDTTGLKFIHKINSIVATLITSNVFESMAQSLVRYSHVLVADVVKRDPSNLPSLCSVYEGGRDCLALINNQSSFPFFLSFVKYLKCSYYVKHDTKNNIELFFRNSTVLKYLNKVVKLSKNLDNWFIRYELSLLTDILQLCCVVHYEDTMKLAFRLLPMLRVDDENAKTVLTVITDSKNWMSNEDCFVSLFEVYAESVYKPVSHSDCVLRYRNDLVEDDWMYKLLTLLRGKEAVAEVGKVLKFIYFILKTNSEYLKRVPYNIRYYHLCAVFLTDANVFDDEIEAGMKNNFKCILENRDAVLLDRKVSKNKSFYDLYTELITQYAAVSYGQHIFAKFVLFPLQNRFDVAFRKLVWSEYIHVLRVITLPYPTDDFLDVSDFSEPYETDESLLITYVNSIFDRVIMSSRNGFVYKIAVTNVRNFLTVVDNPDPKLFSFLKCKTENVKNDRIKQDLTS